MIVFIAGWILLIAYLVIGHVPLRVIPIWIQFIWVELALVGISGGAFYLIATR